MTSCAVCSARFQPPANEWSTFGQLQLSDEIMNLSSSKSVNIVWLLFQPRYVRVQGQTLIVATDIWCFFMVPCLSFIWV